MGLKATYNTHKLIFRFDAGTSRGVLRKKNTHIIRLVDSEYPELIALGEAGPITGLSPDPPFLESLLQTTCQMLDGHPIPSSKQEFLDLLYNIVPPSIPSLRFALETAFYDLLSGSKMLPFPGKFTGGLCPVPINGLVWMGPLGFMRDQVDQKVAEGYDCIKIKIGAIDFKQECSLLDYIRQKYGKKISLRVDANGAFDETNVNQRLETLAAFNLHSIEQPIKTGQTKLLHNLCLETPIPIALDEELIGITCSDQRASLLEAVQPQYIVLKPTLLGGFEATSDWIRLAEERNIQWWITSALESNIGLNALAQYAGTFDNDLPQGLGTGQLYKNNFPSKLKIEKGRLFYRP